MWTRAVGRLIGCVRPSPMLRPAASFRPSLACLEMPLFQNPVRCMSDKRTKKIPLNEEIRSPIVTIVSEDGEVRENVDKRTAVREAKKLGLDLVQVSLQPSEKPKGPPRVICKMFDYRKKIYSEDRSAEPERKMKGDKDMIFKAGIEAHDAGVKIKRVAGFLEKGHPVNLSVEWGNRIEKRPKGTALYDRILEALDVPYSIAKSKTTNVAIRARLNPVFKKEKASKKVAQDEQV
ncbi:hypothetical protein Ae201684P_017226 [Aphanomyces euteiches]|uniref:Translation initiation factor 3 N-terminal domain-containing protein n=1 Tax=Aphanomyces euteiches TaxID=100861 RepID=A0A6G0W4W2_9STRA|nr:hypothetical protein Ae201684_018723 [Aphanomyces euteiches]KAH9088617.1 hypothetical protein Ae201684P_017226 [Aphanomyces euteiches]